MIHIFRILITILGMSLALLGCKESDGLVQVTTLTVSLPATATVDDGWALVQVELTQDQSTQSIVLSETTTTLTVPIPNSTELTIATIAVQVEAGASVTWYTSTQNFDPMGGENTLDIQASAAPGQAVNFQPHLYHEEAQANVAWTRELAILFVDLTTGFTTSPLFKTNQDLTMPTDANWVAVFVDEDNYGTQIDTFGSNIAEIVEYHNSLGSSPEGLVFFDHDEGLVLNSTGGVSMGIQGLVGYDADAWTGIVPLVVGQAPTMSTTAESNPASSTDTVDEGNVVLTEVAGFPETDTAFSIECAASPSCAAATGWQGCNQAFEVTESTMFMVRYDEIPTLGCLSFEIRMDTNANLGGDCDDGRTCSDALACDCSEECSSSACGTEGCGSCGACAATDYCGANESGEFSCTPKCVTPQEPSEAIGVKGLCTQGRQLYGCFQGTRNTIQCYAPEGLGSDEYQCGYTADGFATCLDLRAACSPNCTDLKLGETDGCGQICGVHADGHKLPCSEAAPLSCDPELPEISCVAGEWEFN
ncbi:MAG: hypothetical protein HOK97_08625 [Deltaproteobacteria bacterium]|nr:hypothetical protein [Deltaproteobacteria bacterium]